MSGDDPTDACCADEPRLITVAELARFARCPRSFAFARDGAPALEPGSYLLAGRMLRDALRLLAASVSDETLDESTRIRVALDGAWKRHASEFPEGIDAELLHDDLRAVLSDYEHTYTKAGTCIAHSAAIRCELPGMITLKGSIDRVDEHRDGLALVFFKLGRHPLTVEEVADDLDALCGLLLARNAYPRPVHLVRYQYVRIGSETLWAPQEGDLERAQQEAASLSQLALGASDYPPLYGSTCFACGYRQACELKGC